MTREQIRFRDDDGQTMAEYVVVLGAITLAIVTSFAVLSGAIEAAYGETVDLISSIT